ncbi:MAG TPA: response regulator, partial [Bacteroidales bacterium]|nr:response regulator [Bacteroidales bacterium]
DIDLILMDIKMPVLSGIEAIKLIRKLNPDIPIIAQTAYAMQEDKELILQSGCNNYLPKPIKTNDLLNMLNQYL